MCGTIDFRSIPRYDAPVLKPSTTTRVRRKPKAETSSSKGTETIIRVRYAETDGQGIVYSAHYLVWFEIGRTEWCREAGLHYRGIEARGYFLVVTGISCRYLSPARYDDEVVIRTWITAANRRTVHFRYDIRKLGTGQRLAAGESTHVWVDHEGKLTTLPPPLRRPFEEGREHA